MGGFEVGERRRESFEVAFALEKEVPERRRECQPI